MSKKLYLVKLTGNDVFTDFNYKKSFVVAEDPHEAYELVRSHLEDKDWGTESERELFEIALIAHEEDDNSVGAKLFYKQD